MAETILLANGPNLNMLGEREPDKYGSATLADIVGAVRKVCSIRGFELEDFQSNSEGELIDFIQKKGKNAAGLLINAGAFTHTSIAIRDAILSVNVPFVELHLSNVFKRESFRHVSYLSDIAIGVIAGFGENSYYLAATALIDFLGKRA